MEEGLSIGHEAVVELTRPSRLLPHLVLEHLVGEPERPELVGGVVHEEAVLYLPPSPVCMTSAPPLARLSSPSNWRTVHL